MPPFLQAALLGVVQGLTEFLPVSSTAHLLIGEQLIGFQDPGGVFTVMIQLGSILAIMWLYRAKILDVLAGLASKPEARHFALMIVVATIPALAGRRAVLSDFVKGVLYQSFGVIAVAFIVGGIVMLLVERFRPRPTVTSVDEVPIGRAVVVGACQALALIPGVSRSGGTIVGGVGDGPRPCGRGGVLLLSRDADDGRGVRAQPARGAAPPGAGARAGDRGRVRDGVRRVPARGQAVPELSCGDPGSRRSPGIASRSAWPCSRRSSAGWL